MNNSQELLVKAPYHCITKVETVDDLEALACPKLSGLDSLNMTFLLSTPLLSSLLSWVKGQQMEETQDPCLAQLRLTLLKEAIHNTVTTCTNTAGRDSEAD